MQKLYNYIDANFLIFALIMHLFKISKSSMFQKIGFGFICFIILNSNFSIAQNQLNNLIKQVEQKQSYHDKINNMILLSRIYRETDGEKAIEYAKKTIAFAEKNNDSLSLARIFHVYATNLDVQGNYPLSLKYLNKALSILHNRKDDFSIGYSCFLKSYQINHELQSDSALFYKKQILLNNAIIHFSKINNNIGLADSYYSLSLNLVHIADLPTHKLFKYGPNSAISKQYSKQIQPLKLYNEAIKYNYKAYQYYKLAGMKNLTAACIADLARIKILLNQFNEASILLDSAIKIHHFENAIIGEGKCYLLYSIMFKEQHQIAKSLIYAQKALEQYIKSNYNLEIGMVLKHIASLYELQNNYKKALSFNVQAFDYQEKNYNENRINALFEIQNTYENQLKNLTIRKLKSEQKLTQLEKQQTLNYIYIAAFVFVILLLSALLIYIFKEKSLKEARKNIELTKLLNLSLTQKVNEAELTAMRAEMNPHFVFNTMNSIQGLIVSNKQNEAITYLNDFSRLSRRILEQSSSKLIRFNEEIAFLKNYLSLESLRFDDKFSIIWQIDDSIEQNEIEIPPMLIQPFLENAIKHGLLPKQGKGEINIRFLNKPEESILYCEITDNGVGRNHTSNIQKEHNSKGIAITEKRFELLNTTESEDQNYTFNIVDLKDENNQATGTQVQLFIPYINL